MHPQERSPWVENECNGCGREEYNGTEKENNGRKCIREPEADVLVSVVTSASWTNSEYTHLLGVSHADLTNKGSDVNKEIEILLKDS
jgi:hypothetical protein